MNYLLKPVQETQVGPLLKKHSDHDSTVSGLLKSKVAGKSGRIKRLVLDTPTGLVEVRIPKSLRYLAQLELEVGEPMRVWLDGSPKNKTALALVPLNPRTVLPHVFNPARTCILVCTSKTCSRKGGDDLHSKLVEATAAHPTLEVKKSSCLKQCRKGPNVKIAGRGVEPLTPGEVPGLVQKLRPKSAWN